MKNLYIEKTILKILIMTKLVVALLVTAALSVHARSYSQTLTIHEKSIQLTELFKIINKQTGYAFVVDKDLVSEAGPVQLQVDNASIEEVLDIALKPQGLDYSIRHNIIVLKRVPANVKSSATRFQIQPQERRALRGKVTDQDGRPFPNVNVRIKGTPVAVVTDMTGAYLLNYGFEGEELLVFSYIGYKTVEEKVGTRSSIDVQLAEATDELESVVVTGLYSRPTENFTGAATTVSGEQLRNVNTMSVFDALKVFDPAFRVPDNLEFGSDPNRFPQVSIRGTNNFPVQGIDAEIPASGADFMAAYGSNPSMPLFILDGFEVSIQRIYDLDINRIEQITILKDAVGTSAYGSRAANGVIVVETRQPKPGKLTVSYATTIQLTAPDLTSYRLLNSSEKIALEKAGGVYMSTGNPEFQRYYDELYSARKSEVEKGVNTYWLAQPVQNGWGNKQSISVEGGDSYLRYNAAFGYTNNIGVMQGSSRDNYEGSMLIAYRRNNLLIRNQLTVSANRSDNSPYGSFAQYTSLNPYWSPYDSEGNVKKILDVFRRPGYADETIITNPMYNADLGTTDYSKYTGFNNNTYLEYRVGKFLRLTGKFGLISQQDESHRFKPADHTDFVNIRDYNSTEYFTRGSYVRGSGGFLAYDGSVIADYSQSIGKNLFFATVGFSLAQQSSNTSSFSVRGFPNARLDEFFYGKEYLRDSRPAGSNEITRRTSVFTSLNYTYDKRYLLDFSWNTDGSTQFGSENRFAPFWAVGAGWNVHEEGFMSSLKSGAITRLRIRAGVGTTGSQQFSPYMAVSTYQYNSSQDYTGMFGAMLMTFGNSKLKWQQTMKYNLGTDLSLWRDWISLRLEAYQEVTNDLLLDINTPPSLGVSSYKENIGKLQNRGVEANINAFLIKNERESVFLSVFANGIHNNNRILEISNSLTKLNEQNDSDEGNRQTRPQLRFVEGQSVNAIWTVASGGIDPSTGQEIYYDQNGELTYQWNAANKVIAGDAIAKLNGNFGMSFSYKGLQVSAHLGYQLGGTLYNQTLVDRVENADIRFNVDERVLLGRWQQPGDRTFFKGLTDIDGNTITSPTRSTSRFVQKDNHIDLSSLSVGYVFSDQLMSKWRLKNTRISFMVNNMGRISSIQVERGLSYPFARTCTFNLSTSF